MDTFILHIVHRDAWAQAQTAGSYEPPSLHTEGFIHCSTADQIAGTANTHFQGRRGLLLLHIDVAHLNAELLYELAPGTVNHFPHIYGPLNLDAVTRVETFEPDANGAFHPLSYS